MYMNACSKKEVLNSGGYFAFHSMCLLSDVLNW